MRNADDHIDDQDAILAISLESLSTIAEHATDEILDVMEAQAQKAWDGEYTLAHL